MIILPHGAGEDHARRLLPQHLDDLRRSGLTDATVAACGFYSVSDPHAVAALLGNYLSPKTAAKLGPCLVIPYLDPTGEPMTDRNGAGTTRPFVRLKPDRPRTDRTRRDRKVKYESPGRTPCRAYFPPATRTALGDPSVPLLVTEGEKKAACADQ